MGKYTTIEVLPYVWNGASAECLSTGEVMQREQGRIVFGGEIVQLNDYMTDRMWRIVGGAYVARAGGQCPRCGVDNGVEAEMCVLCAMPLAKAKLETN